MKVHIVFLLLMFANIEADKASYKKGHHEPLGKQRDAEGHIDVLKEVPSGLDFHVNYSSVSKPFIVKKAAGYMPAYFEWDDGHLRRKYGPQIVDVLERKTADTFHMRTYTMKDFLKIYKKKKLDLAMNFPVREKFTHSFRVLPCLACGGHLNVLQEAYVWLSGKHTKTVLEQYPYSRFVCLFTGSKRFYMVHPDHGEHIKLDGPQNKFPSSLLDPDFVDLVKYAGISKAPWWEANVEQGDCIFVPSNWFTQANSYPDEWGRHLEFNLLLYHLPKINVTECKKSKIDYAKTAVSIESINLNDENKEAVRLMMLLELENAVNQTMDRKELFKRVEEGLAKVPHTPSKITDYQVLMSKKKNISLDELYLLNSSEMFLLAHTFPGLRRKGDTMEKINTPIFVKPDAPKHDEL